jgi:hypothetical protein
MFYLDGKLRVAPLHIGHPRTLERSPGRSEARKLSEKLFPLITTKRVECRL